MKCKIKDNFYLKRWLLYSTIIKCVYINTKIPKKNELAQMAEKMATIIQCDRTE